MLNKFFEKLKLMLQDKVLRQRVIFTLTILVVFRALAAIPIPSIDHEKLAAFFSNNQFLGLLDIFSGGGLSNLSIVMLGVGPYITASIIMQLLTMMSPKLKALYHEEGEAGRKKISQWSRYLAVPLCVANGLGFLLLLQKQGAIPDLGTFSFVVNVITVSAGSMLLMWLGELVTEFGIGNGVSLIIFAGIVGGLPSAVMGMIKLVQVDEISLLSGLIILAMVFLIVAFVIWVQTAQRKIPVQYAQRMVGRKMMGGASTFLPLKVDQSGVIAVIFAVSLLSVPYTVGSFNPDAAWAQKLMGFMNHTSLLYQLFYVALIIFFCYFYNSVSINPKDLAENMKKWGGFIPGIRPGEPTAQHIEWVLNRITLGGALFVSAIAVLPDYLRAKFNVPFYFGGTSLLIVVGVALDTIAQTEAHLVMRNYEGFYKNSRVKGRWFNVGS